MVITENLDTMGKEMKALFDLKCFEFHQPSYQPRKLGYQFAPTHIIFDTKKEDYNHRKLGCHGKRGENTLRLKTF